MTNEESTRGMVAREMVRLGREHDWSGDTRAVAVRLGGLIDGLVERLEHLEAEVRAQPQAPVAREQGRFPESEAGDAYREAVRRADEREREWARATSRVIS